jgi:uncharacterized protein YbbC (DUF1343 family)
MTPAVVTLPAAANASLRRAFDLCIAKTRRNIEALADRPRTWAFAVDGHYPEWNEGFHEIGNWTSSFITMANCLEAAGKARLRFIVLDRVNPIGATVEGPVLTAERSFVAAHEIPLRHGMTVGELARLINAERKFGADLSVIRGEGGSPLRWFDETGLPWRDPSPNMRSVTAATLYPGVGLLEFCKVSVGRGTGTPFELLGAPYINDLKLAEELNKADLKGVRFVPVRFTPTASVFKEEECRGVRLLLTDRETFRAADLGMVLAATLHRLYPAELKVDNMAKLLGDAETLAAIRRNDPLEKLRETRDRELVPFMERRALYLLYTR